MTTIPFNESRTTQPSEETNQYIFAPEELEEPLQDHRTGTVYYGNLILATFNCKSFIEEKGGKFEVFVPIALINSKKKGEIKDLANQVKKSTIQTCGEFQKLI